MTDSKSSEFMFCETLVIRKKDFLYAMKLGKAVSGNCSIRVVWKNDDTEIYHHINVSDAFDIKNPDQKRTCLDIENYAIEILKNIHEQMNY